MKPKTLAIDFDGTICRKQKYGDGTIWQTTNPGAQGVIQDLKKDGYRIVVYTVRLSPDKVKAPTREGRHIELEEKRDKIVEWLNNRKIPFDDVVGYKPEAMAYIDDRAVRFTNWKDISNYFLQ